MHLLPMLWSWLSLSTTTEIVSSISAPLQLSPQLGICAEARCVDT